jgi:hypothetical protein
MPLETVNDYITAGLTHSIHTSERRSFRGCRRRWDWISRQFYYPVVTARPLEFGVAFHGAMEEYYKSYLGLFINPDPAASLAAALGAFRRITKEQRLKYIKLNGDMDEEMKADYADRLELGAKMLKYYFTRIAPKQDKGLKPVKVEIKFEVPITNPDGEQDLWCKCDWCWRRFMKWQTEQCQCPHGMKDGWGHECDFVRYADWKGLPVTYGGRLDILWEDSEGNYWIGDWKTAARLSGEEGSDEYLWNDDQITAYVWALRSIGINVVGFIYMEIKKAVPEQPEPLQRARLGRLFSVSKSMTTSAELYETTVKECDPSAYEAGLYDEFIEYLREEGTSYHRWHMIMRNDVECKEAAYNIWLEARDMTNPSLAIYPNQGRFHCKGFTPASGCAFWEPCLAKNRGEDHQYALDTMYQRLDRHYWEDAEPTTEKRSAA